MKVWKHRNKSLLIKMIFIIKCQCSSFTLSLNLLRIFSILKPPLCIAIHLHLHNLSHHNQHLYMIITIIISTYLPLFSSIRTTLDDSSFVSSSLSPIHFFHFLAQQQSCSAEAEFGEGRWMRVLHLTNQVSYSGRQLEGQSWSVSALETPLQLWAMFCIQFTHSRWWIHGNVHVIKCLQTIMVILDTVPDGRLCLLQLNY